MPWATPPGAKLRKDKASAVLLPGLAIWITEDAPSSTRHTHFSNPLNCKIFLQPPQLSPVTNQSAVYILDNGLLVNYNARKKMEATTWIPQKEILERAILCPKAFPVPLALVLAGFPQSVSFTRSSLITASQWVPLALSITMCSLGSFHPISRTLFSVSGLCTAGRTFRISSTHKVL